MYKEEIQDLIDKLPVEVNTEIQLNNRLIKTSKNT